MTKEIRRNMPLFPMSIVMQLTELSARQIRYYEQQGLITPKRNKGKQRIFSLNDIDRLLEIKDLLDQGVNIAGIKAIVALKEKDGQQTVAAEVGHKHNQDQEEISDRIFIDC